MTEDDLNPAQRELFDQLKATPDERPRFDPALRKRLREDLDRGLAGVLDEFEPDTPLWVNKHLLGRIMGCERFFLAEFDEPFSWSVPRARGTIAHKAIELSVHTPGEPTPMELVGEAIGSLVENPYESIAGWLQECSERELAELRGEANDRVARFLELWFPLESKWLPVTEARLRYSYREEIFLNGKVDLCLGRPRGNQAGKVLIDLKTGRGSPQHLDDLRFYALLETLVVGTPPRLLGTYYLDQGRLLPEAVTEELLDSTVARVVDGAARIAKTLKREQEPTTAPGPPCKWCPVQSDCEPGQRYLAEDDLESDDFGGFADEDEDDEDEDEGEAEGD